MAAVGLGCGAEPWALPISMVPVLLLCAGSCRVRRAGVTCWAPAPGCNPCFHEQAPSYGAIEDPEQSLA